MTKYIGTVEYARTLGVSTRTIYRRIADGSLEPDMIADGGRHGIFLFKKPDTKKPAAQ